MLKILFIGDINGKIGRQAAKEVLPELKKELKPDLVIANAENIAHGKGLTVTSLKEVLTAGVDWFTGGDHAFDQEKQIAEVYNDKLPVLRPANYPEGVPGRGYALIKVDKYQILLITLIGRVFMRMNYDCPFKKLTEILAKPDLSKKKLSAIIVDIHAEATSEKVAFKHFADGQVSAILGTHTHVMTADAKITAQGTAYITDVGMVGAAEGVIGLNKEDVIKTFLSQIKTVPSLPETGPAVFNAVFLVINPETGKTKEIKPIIKYINIK